MHRISLLRETGQNHLSSAYRTVMGKGDKGLEKETKQKYLSPACRRAMGDEDGQRRQRVRNHPGPARPPRPSIQEPYRAMGVKGGQMQNHRSSTSEEAWGTVTKGYTWRQSGIYIYIYIFILSYPNIQNSHGRKRNKRQEIILAQDRFYARMRTASQQAVGGPEQI